MVNDFLHNVKAAWFMAVTMLSTSIGSLLHIIPSDIGKLGVLLTAIVSCILIRVQLVNLKNAKAESEIKALQLRQLRETMETRKDDSTV